MPNLKNKLSRPSKLTSAEAFWKEVEKKSKSLMASLLEATLPLDASPKNFDLEKDTDYRVLLREDLPASYQEQEEYQEKVANRSWNEADVEFVSQELAVAYFDLVVKAFVSQLKEYAGFGESDLANYA